jgi:hypothetical protein
MKESRTEKFWEFIIGPRAMSHKSFMNIVMLDLTPIFLDISAVEKHQYQRSACALPTTDGAA